MKKFDKLFINGEWITAKSNNFLTLENPATEEKYMQVGQATVEQVDAAVKAARAAFPLWSELPWAERKDYMLRAADEMDKRYDDLVEAHILGVGTPVSIAGELQVDFNIDGMRFYANLAHKIDEVEERGKVLVCKDAIGVCAHINPWNFPMTQMMMKLAPALAVGCTVVVKPAEITPLQDIILAEIFESIGLPKGVYNLILGPGSIVGPCLAQHEEVDMISLTGSTAAGVDVAIKAAPTMKRVTQELGGKSPYIITEDANLEEAVAYGIGDVMLNTGQTCCALTRMLLPKSRYDEACQLAVRFASEQKVGDPRDPEVTMGPMVSKKQYNTVINYIQKGIDEGARLLCGGTEKPAGCTKGYFIQPTVFADVNNSMTIAREEIFGPVLCLIPYDDIDEAIEIANDTDYGLASGVFAKDKESALQIAKKLRAGTCLIQGGVLDIDGPFGGYKKSGNGREQAEEGLHEYMEIKAIISP